VQPLVERHELSGRRERLYRISAIVLRRRDMGEADRLLTVMTRERGKLVLLAKGVRKSASRKAGHLEPFTHVELLAAKGRNLDLITQAETLSPHRRLREDLWRSTWAYYVVELADAFTQDEDPNQLLFDLLLETLGRLDTGSEPAVTVRYYELHLLAVVGYQPQLFRCVECGELLKPEINFLSLERGGALCPKHGAHRPETAALPLTVLKVLRFMQSRPWEQIARLRLGVEVSGQVEGILARYIVHHLERTLRSPLFLDRIKLGLAQAPDMMVAASGRSGDP